MDSVALVCRGGGGVPSDAMDSWVDWEEMDVSSGSSEKVKESSSGSPLLEVGWVCSWLSCVLSSVSSSESDSKRSGGGCVHAMWALLGWDNPEGQSLVVTLVSCPGRGPARAVSRLKSDGGPLVEVSIRWKMWISFLSFVPQLPLSLVS